MRSSRLKFLFAVAVSFFCIVGNAQTPEEIEAKMNEIKLDDGYIYGEDFSDDKDISFQNALTELASCANEIRVGKGLDQIKISDLQTVVRELRYQKGARFAVLLYLPVSQMLDLKSRSHIGVVSQPVAPLPVPPPVEKPQTDLTPVAKQPQPQPDVRLPDDVLRTLCSLDNWLEIKGYLAAFRNNGKISAIGNTRTYSDVPSDAIAILMDDLGGILSILSPKGGGKQINYRTNFTDNESNHSDCKFIVWYK